jgi:hypothetical protein
VKDPRYHVVKVTHGAEHSFFVRFARDGHDLVDVFEYKKVYTPGLGMLSNRIKTVIWAARSELDKTPATNGD